MSYYTEPPQAEYWDCHACGGAFRVGRSEFYDCHHPECQELERDCCAGCIHSCRNCDIQFCSEHMDQDNEYCVRCRAKYPKTQQTEAA